MGNGSGVNAVLAASKAAKVLAVDINPHALATARDNALRNGVANRVEVRRRDVFSNVDGTFDVIVFRSALSLVRPSRLARSRHHG
jgi:release factor glutamine methyltransferase